MTSPPHHVPLWKQCLGAVVGAVTALAIYFVFTVAFDYLSPLTASVGGGASAIGMVSSASSLPPVSRSASPLLETMKERVAKRFAEYPTAAAQVLSFVASSQSSTSSVRASVSSSVTTRAVGGGAPLSKTGMGVWFSLALSAAIALSLCGPRLAQSFGCFTRVR